MSYTRAIIAYTYIVKRWRTFSPPSPFKGSALMIAGGTKSPVLNAHSIPTVGFWLVPAPQPRFEKDTFNSSEQRL